MLNYLIFALDAVVPAMPTYSGTWADILQKILDILATILNGVGGVIAVIMNNPLLLFAVAGSAALIIVGVVVRLFNMRA